MVLDEKLLPDHVQNVLISLQEGEEIIADFLKKVRALPLSDLSEEDAMVQLNKLKLEVKEKNNPYVEDVLARGT